MARYEHLNKGITMSTIRVGINGFGRIGRNLLREFILRKNAGEFKNIEISAVNNPGDINTFAHLLKYDSVHGRYPLEVKVADNHFLIGDHKVRFFSERDPAQIDWSGSEVSVVCDSTGIFKTKETLGKHLNGSVKKVIMCAPGQDLDGTFVVGINTDSYDANNHHIISNASCTTNCLAPVAKVLHENFGIENGFMTTIHAYTQDQNILDSNHRDLRRARAAGMNMIPTSTGAAKAVGLVLPELKGKLDGFAVRVPTADVSLVDLTVTLKKPATKEVIHEALKKASQNDLKGVLGFNEEPLVSIDYTGERNSSVVDAGLTNVIGNTAKVVSWYDNEIGFSNRVLDLADFVISKL